MKKITFLIFNIVFIFAHAMDNNNSYDERELTPHDTVSFMQKTSPLPEEIKYSLESFFQTYEGLMSALTQPRLKYTIQKEHEENLNLLIRSLGYQNHRSTEYNHIITLYTTNEDNNESEASYSLYIPTIKNKYISLLKMPNAHKHTVSSLFKHPTFIGISHAAAYVRFLELKKKHKITAVQLLPLHLTKIPGSNDPQPTDAHYFLLKKNVVLKPVAIQSLSSHAFKELLYLIKEIPLSRITDNTLKEDNAGIIYLDCAEDEFQHNSAIFFFNDSKKREQHAEQGMHSVRMLIQNEAEKSALFNNVVKATMNNHTDLLL